MRIIAGKLKGRRIASPKDSSIRPTTDKVKEALFSMVQLYLEDAIVIDLFSGTGNLGLEAISRGAARCYFCDRSRDSISLTRENIKGCGVEDQGILLSGDYGSCLDRVKEKADIILLDPPYEKDLLEKCIRKISDLDLLQEDGIIVAERGSREELKEEIGSFSMIKEKRYGTIRISLFAKSEK
jgi:16S rRNA (guanine(966)-N(2))-methyltransferase RsmD